MPLSNSGYITVGVGIFALLFIMRKLSQTAPRINNKGRSTFFSILKKNDKMETLAEFINKAKTGDLVLIRDLNCPIFTQFEIGSEWNRMAIVFEPTKPQKNKYKAYKRAANMQIPDKLLVFVEPDRAAIDFDSYFRDLDGYAAYLPLQTRRPDTVGAQNLLNEELSNIITNPNPSPDFPHSPISHLPKKFWETATKIGAYKSLFKRIRVLMEDRLGKKEFVDISEIDELNRYFADWWQYDNMILIENTLPVAENITAD